MCVLKDMLSFACRVISNERDLLLTANINHVSNATCPPCMPPEDYATSIVRKGGTGKGAYVQRLRDFLLAATSRYQRYTSKGMPSENHAASTSPPPPPPPLSRISLSHHQERLCRPRGWHRQASARRQHRRQPRPGAVHVSNGADVRISPHVHAVRFKSAPHGGVEPAAGGQQHRQQQQQQRAAPAV